MAWFAYYSHLFILGFVTLTMTFLSITSIVGDAVCVLYINDIFLNDSIVMLVM